MREILFRGKDPETGQWYEGQYIHLHKSTYCFATDYAAHPDNDIHQIVFERMTDWCLPNQHLRADVDPDTVGQYTGLKDKNGKRIFEGDVVNFKTAAYSFEKCYIRWHERTAQFVATEKNCIRTYPIDNVWEFEVIGNIHDNPELLKEET